METSEIKSKTYPEIKLFKEPSIFTGQANFDKWFSSDGGIICGSAIYVSGNSGAGKTTLMINLMKWLKDYKTSMYSREMASRSVKEQTLNMGIGHKNAFIADIKDCPNFEEYMKELDIIKPKVVIVDSLQVIAKEDYESRGAMSEDKACYEIIKRLREWIDKNNAILFLIGHSTKGDDGEFLGSNTILHMLDADIKMLFNKKENYRTISWGHKNRKGPMSMLYFSIEKEGIEFFNEEEFQSRLLKKSSKKVDFEDFIFKSICSYLSSVNKNSPNYDAFKKDYVSGCKSLEKNYSDDSTGYLSEVIKLIHELSKKHEIC